MKAFRYGISGFYLAMFVLLVAFVADSRDMVDYTVPVIGLFVFVGLGLLGISYAFFQQARHSYELLDSSTTS